MVNCSNEVSYSLQATFEGPILNLFDDIIYPAPEFSSYLPESTSDRQNEHEFDFSQIHTILFYFNLSRVQIVHCADATGFFNRLLWRVILIKYIPIALHKLVSRERCIPSVKQSAMLWNCPVSTNV